MAVHAQMGSGVLLAIWGIANIFDRGTLGNLSNPLVVGYGLLKLLGLGMGSILLWYEVDRYNPVLQGFCSGDKKVNCDSVLNSRYSKMSNGHMSLMSLPNCGHLGLLPGSGHQTMVQILYRGTVNSFVGGNGRILRNLPFGRNGTDPPAYGIAAASHSCMDGRRQSL